MAAPSLGTGCAGNMNRGRPATAPAPQVAPLGEHDVLGWVRVRSTARLSQVAGAVGGRSQIDQALLLAAGLPSEAREAADLDRPAVVALLDPQRFGSSSQASGRPTVAWIPLRDEAAFRRAVDPTVSKGPLRAPGGQAWIDVHDKVAVLAPDAGLLPAARRTLAPIASRDEANDLVVHVGIRNIMDAYGDRAEQAMSELADLTRSNGSDRSTGFAMRSVRRLAAFATSADAVDITARVQSDGVAVTARMTAKQDGSWARYIAQQRPGTGWGTELLPADSVLVYTTHVSPQGKSGEAEDSLAYLDDLSDQQRVAGGRHEQAGPGRRAAVEKAFSSLNGELAYGVWPAPNGGVGLGGGYKVNDARQAREAMLGLHAALKTEAAQLAADQLELPAKATHVTLKPAAMKVGGVPIDVAELSVRWPKNRASERRSFEWLFGHKLVLATAAVGDRVVFALGRDARERVATMIRISQGQAEPSVREAPGFAQAQRFRGDQRVSLAYLPLGPMSQFIERLVHATTPDSQGTAEVLHMPSSSAIVSTTNLSPNAYEVTTFLPNAILRDLGSTGGALWRIAFQPVLNPPQVPPLPIPPPQLTPPAQSPTEPDDINSPTMPPGFPTPSRPMPRPVTHPA